MKAAVVASLKKGFEHEEDDAVIPWIIIMLETILVKKLGLREDKEDPTRWHGDLQKAKQLLSAANYDMNKEVVFLTAPNNNLATVYQQQLARGGGGPRCMSLPLRRAAP